MVSVNGDCGRLAGKVAVITGGASGIGAGTARRFIAEGVRAVIADMETHTGKSLAEELGEDRVFVRTDVRQEHDPASAVDVPVERFGRLDIMFNNAGVIGAIGSIVETRADDIEPTIQVNLRGTLFGMKHVAGVMRSQRTCAIHSASSPAGLAGATVYLASDDAAFVTGCTLPVDAGMTWAGRPSPYATGQYEYAGVFGAQADR